MNSLAAIIINWTVFRAMKHLKLLNLMHFLVQVKLSLLLFDLFLMYLLEMGQLLLEDHVSKQYKVKLILTLLQRFDIFRENIQLKWEKEQSDKVIKNRK